MFVPVLRRLPGYIRSTSPFFAPGLRSMPVTAFSWIPHCYPPTHRSDHIDIYQSEAKGEVKVPNPYAWLEEDGEERKRWLASQEALARKLLDSHPDRALLEEEIRSSTNYEKVSFLTLWTQRGSIYLSIQFGSPSLRDDGRWYWLYNSGLQPQSGLSPHSLLYIVH